MNGHVVGDARIMLFAVVPGEMQTDPAKMLTVGVGLQNRPWTHRHARTNLHPLEFVPAQGQGGVKGIGLAQHGPVINPHAGSDKRRGLSRGDLFGFGGAASGHDPTSPINELDGAEIRCKYFPTSAI